MANNLTENTSQIVLKKFLDGFMSDIVLAKSIDTQIIEGELDANTGDIVRIKLLHQIY